jgi:hypothetical protein
MLSITYETFIVALIGCIFNSIDMIFTIHLLDKLRERFYDPEKIEINHWRKLFAKGWKYSCLFISIPLSFLLVFLGAFVNIKFGYLCIGILIVPTILNYHTLKSKDSIFMFKWKESYKEKIRKKLEE